MSPKVGSFHPVRIIALHAADLRQSFVPRFSSAVTFASLGYPLRIGLTQSRPVRFRGPRLFRFSAPASKLSSLPNKIAPHYVRGFVTLSGFKPETF